MIAFCDFVPRSIPGGLFSPLQTDSFRAALEEANIWIESNGVRVLNVETVVLPNIHCPGEKGSEDTSLRTSGDLSSHWHQFVRVWYAVATPPPLPQA